MLALITNQSNHSIKKNIQLVQKYINLQKQTFGLVLIFLAFMTH
jgi:two-component sensor histidine kinase